MFSSALCINLHSIASCTDISCPFLRIEFVHMERIYTYEPCIDVVVSYRLDTTWINKMRQPSLIVCLYVVDRQPFLDTTVWDILTRIIDSMTFGSNEAFLHYSFSFPGPQNNNSIWLIKMLGYFAMPLSYHYWLSSQIVDDMDIPITVLHDGLLH